MPFALYRLYYKQIFAAQTVGNIDGRYYDDIWTATQITFKARNENEAIRKASKFWKDGQFGMGSIIVKQIRKEEYK